MGAVGRVAASVVVVAALGACAPAGPNFAGLKMGARRAELREQILLRTLTNGLRVVVLPDKRTNLVMVGMHYAVGSADDPQGNEGLAHYIEHVLFDATFHGGDAAALRDVGLEANAYTQPDRTFFYQKVLDVELADALEIAARRLEVRCEDLDEPSIERERDVVVEEAKLRDVDRSVGAAANLAIWGVGHPYARAPGGTAYRDVTRPAMCKFIDEHYGPASAVLVVAGNVPDDALDRIAVRFGRVPARAPATRTPHTAPIQTLRLVVHDLERPTALIAFPVPPEGTAADAAVAALDRHVWRLVGDTPSATAMTFVSGGEQARAIVAVAEVADAKRLDELVAAMRRTFEKPALEDFVTYRQARQAQLAAELDDPFEAVDAIAAAVSRGERPSRFRDLRQLEVLGQADAVRLFDAPKIRLAILLPEVGVKGKGHVTEATTSLHDVGVPRGTSAGDRSHLLHVLQRPLAVTEYQLGNGLRVVLAPDSEALAVDARLIIAGTHDATLRGIDTHAAAFLHADTRNLPSSAYQRLRWYQSVAAPVGQFVEMKSTTFFIRGYALFADWHVWNLAWTVLHGSYSEQMLRAAEKARQTARRERPEPPTLIDALRAQLEGSVDIPERTIQSASELDAFRGARYRPERSTLVVTGAFDVAAMRKEIDALFGHWKATRPEPTVPPGRPRLRSVVGIDDDDSRTVELAIVFALRDAPALSDAPARAVLGEMLAQRLWSVRERMGASYAIDAGPSATGMTIIGAIEPAFAAEATKAIAGELDRIRTGDAALADDFARARKRVLANALSVPLGVSLRADALQTIVGHGGSAKQLADQVAALQALDITAVQQLATRELQPERMITALRGQAKAVEAAATGLGFATDTIEWMAAPGDAKHQRGADRTPKWATR